MRLIHSLTFLVVLGLVAGCGGGGQNAGLAGGAGRGSATFRITWPDANSRLIPIASQSIKIVVQESGIGQQKVVATQIVPRPTTGNTSVVKIDNLPVKKLTDVITAHPNANGAGVAQAEGSAPVDIKKDTDVAVSVTMISTIVLISLSPPSPATVAPGGTFPIVATPRDFSGQQVLIRPNTLQWLSSNPSVATVDAAGMVTGVKGGTANITVTEPESGKTGTLTVTVSDCYQATVTLITETANYPPGGFPVEAHFWSFPYDPAATAYDIDVKNPNGTTQIVYHMLQSDVESTPVTEIYYITGDYPIPPMIPLLNTSDRFNRRGNSINMLLVWGGAVGENDPNYYARQRPISVSVCH